MIASSRLIFIAVIACICGGNRGLASCLPGAPPPTLYVGSDNNCNYATIQAAIDAVSTTATCAPNIVVTNELVWTAQHLTITDRALTLIGTSGGCGIGNTNGDDDSLDTIDTLPTSPQVTISGAGQTSASVITIGGNSTVTLRYLEITGGKLSSQGSRGGGILFTGAGALTLDTSTVDHNQANYGGGIAMNPSGSATLMLLSNSIVSNNSAVFSGGGIRIEGNTHLIMVSTQTQIASNSVADNGGGLDVVGPARADIGSGGYNGAGVIANNSAGYGGGIAVESNAIGKNATVQLFSTDAEHPVNIQNNQASIEGGAIYLSPYQDASGNHASALACVSNFRIDGNTATEGAAIYIDWASASGQNDYGGVIMLNPSGAQANNCGTPTPADFGAVACATDVSCNELSGNSSEDTQGSATDASIVFVGHFGFFEATALRMTDNHAGEIIYASGSSGAPSFALLSACLISNNALSQTLLLGANTNLSVQNCTFSNNSFLSFGPPSPHYQIGIDAGSRLILRNSILAQSGGLALSQPGSKDGNSHLNVQYLLSNDLTTLPSSSTVLSADPLFVDARNRNYHLQASRLNNVVTASAAIDFAPNDNTGATDLDGSAYGQDVAAVANRFGAHDLGAYEMRSITDRIFADGLGDAVSIVY